MIMINSNFDNTLDEITNIIQYYSKPGGTEQDVNLIIPNLWLGNINICQNFDFVVRYRINYILNITKKIPNYFNFVDYTKIHLEDLDLCTESDQYYIDLLKIFNTVADDIHIRLSKGEPILVHCKRGHHRSASFIVFYLMKYHNLTLTDAIIYVKKIRPTSFRRVNCILKFLIKNQF